MSVITIQCRLFSEEESLLYLWELMTQKNTPLINELLELIGKHPELEEWIQKGKLPTGLVKTLCNSLKTDLRFSGQPGRFYSSAISLVDYIYKSWIALQQRRERQISRKERWLSMLKSDAELEKDCNCSLDVIRAKATEVLTQIATPSDLHYNQPTENKKGKKSKKGKADKAHGKLFSLLFDAYENTTDPLERCSLAYLLKNGCQISELEEDPEKFATRRRAKEIEIERLKEQLNSRLPKGRNLTGEKSIEALETATHNVPKNEDEAKAGQATLLRKSTSVPFPVGYETNEDLTWFKNDQGRICVRFNGLSEHTFEIWCDQRQLHLFQRFLEDQQTKRDSKNQHSSSLFTLRAARICWLKRQGKGLMWNKYRLILYCSLDTRLLTEQGTQQVISEKAAKIAKILTLTKDKEELDDKQQAFVKRQQSTLDRINTPFLRPSKPLYQGQSSILIGVSLGLKKAATVAVVDAKQDRVLTYRSVKQLLGENYKLLNRQRQVSARHSHERHKAQKQKKPNQFKESELGQYLDRLLALEIIAIAKTYQAGSIVLPKLGDMREIITSEVQARAEQKIPGYKEGQKKYAKQYRVSVHRWSYGRLIECIQSLAAKTGIAIEVGQQPIRGSPQEKARDLALSAYSSRITSMN
jgi:transposase